MGFQVVKLYYLESKPKFLFTAKSSTVSKLARCQISCICCQLPRGPAESNNLQCSGSGG